MLRTLVIGTLMSTAIVIIALAIWISLSGVRAVTVSKGPTKSVQLPLSIGSPMLPETVASAIQGRVQRIEPIRLNTGNYMSATVRANNGTVYHVILPAQADTLERANKIFPRNRDLRMWLMRVGTTDGVKYLFLHGDYVTLKERNG